MNVRLFLYLYVFFPYLFFGEGTMPENMVGEPENRLLGLQNFPPGDPGIPPLDIRGVKPDPAVAALLLCVLIIGGPHLVSNGSGSNPFSAAINAFSMLNFISLHGSILTRKPCFLVR
ncbi:hypothetical protein COP2_040975 [Malus domestica]